VNVYLFTQAGFLKAFSSDILADLVLVQASISLVAIYCILFMGGFSPIHFRSAAAGITLLCVGLSYTASSGLAFYLGWKTAGIHGLLPFLLIGIGVDDMFVISAAIDQTDANLSVEERMKEGIMHSGSSITITSFTNAIAFLLGCTTSLDALSSFCFFAGIGVIFLYISAITIFSSFMAWDIKRQANQKGDCCGACCCSEETVICCKGSCLTQKQKRFPFRGDKPDIAEVGQEEYASGT